MGEEKTPKQETGITLRSPAGARDLVRKYLPIWGTIYRLDISKSQIEIYTRYLEDIPVERLEQAMEAAGRTSEFFPTPAKVRRMAGEQEKQPLELDSARDLLDSERAWDRLRAYIRRWGADCIPEFLGLDQGGKGIFERPEPFDDATEWALRQCGGYAAVVNTPVEDLHFVRERFIKAYQRFCDTDGGKRIGRLEAQRLLGRVVDWEKVDRIKAGEYARKRLSAKSDNPT